MVEQQYELKMYGIVLRHLSGIQKGIQFAHAVARYCYHRHDIEQLQQWVNVDETMILLQANTSNELYEVSNRLRAVGIDTQSFNEPDISGSITGIVFIIDERVWDREKYPDEIMEGVSQVCQHVRQLISPFPLASN
jgi:hypothetical protein